MRILITGASGLVGTALRAACPQDEFTPLTHGQHWDTSAGTIDRERLAGHHAVVHLAGDNIASGRWSNEKKARIRDSRVNGTKLLCAALAELDNKPSVLVSASAVGYYGNRYGELLREHAGPGKGFLADTCRDWEAATQAARDAGIRVVNARIGVILRGVMKRIRTPFRMGVGGRLGSGKQYMSWVSLEDVVAGIQHCLATPALEGPVNLTSPGAVTNAAFTKAVGRALKRPTIFPMPKFVARLAFGEMADALLLSGARVFPERLEQTGFSFRHPEIEAAVRNALDAIGS